MQGQAVVTLAGEVMPSDAAYNFRLDMRAAEEVFAQLHAHKLPVALLGKYAAYQIKLTKQDLESVADPCLPSLAVVARDQMQEFKRQNPEQFFHLFPVPLQFRQGGPRPPSARSPASAGRRREQAVRCVGGADG